MLREQRARAARVARGLERMSSFVSDATACLIFAGTTAKVPSAFTFTAPASRKWLSCSAMPLPCASSMPKRMERNVEARNVMYMVRSIALSSDALVHQLLQREQAGDVRLGLLDARCRPPAAPAHRRRVPVDGDVVGPEAVHQLVHEDVREEGVEGDVLPVRRGPAPPWRWAAARARTWPPARSSASRAWCPSPRAMRSSLGRL